MSPLSLGLNSLLPPFLLFWGLFFSVGKVGHYSPSNCALFYNNDETSSNSGVTMFPTPSYAFFFREIPQIYLFFLNTWPCLLATANYLQGTSLKFTIENRNFLIPPIWVPFNDPCHYPVGIPFSHFSAKSELATHTEKANTCRRSWQWTSSWWLNRPIWKILYRQNGMLPQVVVKINNNWNNHL